MYLSRIYHLYESKPRVILHWLLPIMIATAYLFNAGCNRSAEPQNTSSAFAETETTQPEPTPAPTPEEGTWVSVSRETLQQTFPAAGNFQARQITNIGPQISGRILQVLVDVGSLVKKDQELIRIDPKFIQIEVALRKAEIESAKVTLAQAELDWKRMKALWEVPKGQTPSISQKIYDDAKSGYDIAASRIAIAEESLKLAEEQLRETVIRAPYDGVITQRVVHPGEQVSSNPVSKLLEIQEIGMLEMEFSLPQNLLSQVRKGTPVKFEVEGIRDGKDQSEIAIVYPDLDITTRAFRCRVVVDNSDMKYRPGLLAQVRVVIQEIPNSLCIPSQALSENSSGFQVLVSDAGKPVPRSVEIGVKTEDKVEIRKGLQENEQVFIPKITR